jgi:undecaprenyl-diphosphatase
LIVATAPVAVAGLLLHDWIATAARQPRAVAIPLAVFGVVLWAVDRWAPPGEVVPAPHLGRALAVGCAQALALWPGTSRSGITMTAARGLRFDRTSAARFSFLLSIPATGLAFAADLVDLMRAPVLPVGLPFLIVGFLAAAVSGFAVIAWLLRWVSRHGFLPFAMYRVALAAVILWAL